MEVSKINSVCLVLSGILFSVNLVMCQLPQGSECFHVKSQSSGTCTPLEECEETFKNFIEKDIPPQTCSILKNNQYIVCCRNTVEKPPEMEIESRFLDSRHMCRQYAKALYTTRNMFNVPGALPMNHSECGYPLRPLIYGGELANGKEFPHMALVGYDAQNDDGDFERKWGCGGTLISDQWVLTAAHCVITYQYGDAKYVRLGDLDYNSDADDAKPQDFEVIHRLRHNDYKDTKYNDIGLLKLDKKVMFSAYIRPACLWPENQISQERALITGWGNQNDITEKRASHLQVATLSIMPEKTCKTRYKPGYRFGNGFDNKIQMCAGPKEGESNKDACHGDSGGPIQIYATDIHKCMYYVLGVTSFGSPCGTGRSFGVYARIYHYLSWIEDNVWR